MQRILQTLQRDLIIGELLSSAEDFAEDLCLGLYDDAAKKDVRILFIFKLFSRFQTNFNFYRWLNICTYMVRIRRFLWIRRF